MAQNYLKHSQTAKEKLGSAQWKEAFGRTMGGRLGGERLAAFEFLQVSHKQNIVFLFMYLLLVYASDP